MTKTITINVRDMKCTCILNDASTRVVYMIYPQVEEFSEKWLEDQAKEYGCKIVMVYVPLDKWNDYLTPWPEPGETLKAHPFAGEGPEFLKILQTEIIPQAEKTIENNAPTERNLIGVSLAGLFTFWQWMQCDTFHSIASLSGSFWYMGFMEWFGKQSIPKKQGKAFFLLGTEEPKAHIKAYRSVGINTEYIVDALKKGGINTTFEWVPGNHFANPLSRAEKALATLSLSRSPKIF